MTQESTHPADYRLFAYYLAEKFTYEPAKIVNLYYELYRSNILSKIPFLDDYKSKKKDIAASMDRLEKNGIKTVCLDEPRYPAVLGRNRQEAPVILFIKSSEPIENLFPDNAVYHGITGTKDISINAPQYVDDIIQSIKSQSGNHVIVNGLSMGVETSVCHAALSQDIPVISILPCSIEDTYPANNRSIAEALSLNKGCALVSKFTPGTEFLEGQFILRNQLIATLCNDMYVVESRKKGNAMMTARYAASLGKPVYAVPGRINDYRSEGCNQLIKEHTAEIFTK